MRKKHYLLFFALCSLFISCGGDDDTIVGTWHATLLESRNCTDPLDNLLIENLSDATCTDTSADGCIAYIYTFTETTFTFTASQTEMGQSFSLDGSGTYTIDGNIITLCEAGECDDINLDLNGDSATLTGMGDDGCDNTLRLSRN